MPLYTTTVVEIVFPLDMSQTTTTPSLENDKSQQRGAIVLLCFTISNVLYAMLAVQAVSIVWA